MAEQALEWDTVFFYGISVCQLDGSAFSESPIPVKCFKNGLKTVIYNAAPYADRCTLMFVLNGQVQPFYLDGEKKYAAELTLEANSETSVRVFFDGLYERQKDVQYLHVIVVGMLNWTPANEQDYYDIYATACSIPFIPDNETSVAIEDILQCIPAIGAACDMARENGGMICFSDKIENNDIYIKPAIQEVTLPFELEVTAIAPEERQSVLLLIDGKPWQPEKQLLSGTAADGMALRALYDMDGLELGTHHACAILCPIDDKIVFPIMTHKMKLCVLAE